jgi:hypothetical protein
MIGDIILWCKIFIKQQTCIHNYKYVNRKDNGGSFELCEKCDKIKEKKEIIMTLKEKFINLYPHQTEQYLDHEEAEKCEKIADEYAIEFVNWIVNPDTTDLLHDLELIGEIDKEVTSKKLLEIYKKEKGL